VRRFFRGESRDFIESSSNTNIRISFVTYFLILSAQFKFYPFIVILAVPMAVAEHYFALVVR
jgi:multidrug efflux pump subunit AcrB